MVVKWFMVIANRKLLIFFVLWKTTLATNIFLKLCFFNFFIFEINIFSNRITKTKHSHLSNGSQLTSQTDHCYSSAHIIFVWWIICLPFKILAKLFFLTFFTFEFNIFSNKIPKEETFAFVKMFTTNIVNCLLLLARSRHFCLMKNLFPLENSCKIVFLHLFQV